MKVIILAAGRGSRLNEYTKALPKGMLPFFGKSLLEWEIEAFRQAGIFDIAVVRGYRAEEINISNIRYYENPDWEDMGPVGSLFCAEEIFDGSDDILVAYADTVHEPRIIKQVMKERFSLSKVIDTDYKEYWTMRNGDWKIDSESCTLHPDGSIVEIGEDGVVDEARLHGRDASLTFITREMVSQVLEHYKRIESTYWNTPFVQGKKVKEFNMTNLLQAWIDNGWKVFANKIKRGWMEFDTNKDYENALHWAKTGEIKKLINNFPVTL